MCFIRSKSSFVERSFSCFRLVCDKKLLQVNVWVLLLKFLHFVTETLLIKGRSFLRLVAPGLVFVASFDYISCHISELFYSKVAGHVTVKVLFEFFKLTTSLSQRVDLFNGLLIKLNSVHGKLKVKVSVIQV